ncbi:hypothetical protein PVAP13_8KG331701 [Panicum virgatum]|uniref:Uncharacterized protein n=1 Tax=Panicum virgatum TaxID=38727 RepID=A0A8T0PJR7_PANVG|nr:hypothetical protein PVAP13_8KG331701 [Panicum virgatum]
MSSYTSLAHRRASSLPARNSSSTMTTPCSSSSLRTQPHGLPLPVDHLLREELEKVLLVVVVGAGRLVGQDPRHLILGKLGQPLFPSAGAAAHPWTESGRHPAPLPAVRRRRLLRHVPPESRPSGGHRSQLATRLPASASDFFAGGLRLEAGWIALLKGGDGGGVSRGKRTDPSTAGSDRIRSGATPIRTVGPARLGSRGANWAGPNYEPK